MSLSSGTEIIKVKATDSDEGEFGQVTYEITDPSFAIDPIDGTVTVVNSDFLDRESNPEITLQIVAKDVAPNSKTTSVPLNITVTDVNDNAPRFKKKVRNSISSRDKFRFKKLHFSFLKTRVVLNLKTGRPKKYLKYVGEFAS